MSTSRVSNNYEYYINEKNKTTYTGGQNYGANEASIFSSNSTRVGTIIDLDAKYSGYEAAPTSQSETEYVFDYDGYQALEDAQNESKENFKSYESYFASSISQNQTSGRFNGIFDKYQGFEVKYDSSSSNVNSTTQNSSSSNQTNTSNNAVNYSSGIAEYNAQAGEKIRQAALTVRGTTGWCLAGVNDTLQEVYGQSLAFSSAYKAIEALRGNVKGYENLASKFKEVSVSRDELASLPAGAIVVWDNNYDENGNLVGGSNISDLGREHGHISIALGDGRESSDHIRNQIVNRDANYYVFLPVA